MSREYPRLEKGVILYGPQDELRRKPLPAFSNTEREAPGTGEPMQEVDGDVLSSGPNINTAEVETLVKIKGIGRKTANDIIASREAGGPFQSLKDCADRVGGVTVNQLSAAEAVV